MLGCERTATVWASRSKRARADSSAASLAGRTLIATARPSLASVARYTSPIPPAPSAATISYCPSLVPITVRLHGRRVDRDRCPAVILAHGIWLRPRDVDDGGEGRRYRNSGVRA